MIYLAGWASLYYAMLVGWFTGYRGRLFAVLCLLLIGAIAIFRGDVGTDTTNYEYMFENFQNGWNGVEPGFAALGSLLLSLTGSAVIAVRAISLLFFGLILLFLSRADRNEACVLLGYIVPAFSYEYGMNVLRIGLASSVLLLSVQSLRRDGKVKASVIAVSALAFHYSSLVSVLFLYASQRRWLRWSNFIVIAIAVLAVSAAIYLNIDYFLHKLTSYQVSESPSSLSGLSKVIVILVLLSGLLLSNLPRSDKVKLGLLGAAATMAFWAVARASYAGLRLLDLISFVLPLAILATHSRLGLKFNWRLKSALLAAGFIAAVATYRGFLLSAGVGVAPFLPYGMR